MKVKNNLRGFSLIELMIVVALIALFLMMAAPSIRIYLENSKVRNVAESIEAGMQKARLNALQHNNLTQFVIRATGGVNDGWVIREQILAAGTPTYNTIETFVWGAGGSNWTSVSVTSQGGANAVTFNTMGMLVTANNTTWPAPPTVTTTPISQASVASNTGMTGVVPLRVDVGTRAIRVCRPDLTRSDDPKAC